MEFLWAHICGIADKTKTIAAGDTACGFGNTAMVLAERKYIPRIFSALVRAATIVRSLVAYDKGASGPGKDCGYENPFLKAITGYPMSMEGKSAVCAHSSPLGNIAGATCDLWSNESVQNIKLLAGMAPTVSLEQLIYDCRLMNQALTDGCGIMLRNIMVKSDALMDPQALILTPENVLRIAEAVVTESGYYKRTKAAITSALSIIEEAHEDGRLVLVSMEEPWLPILGETLAKLPSEENNFIESVLPALDTSKFIQKEYKL